MDPRMIGLIVLAVMWAGFAVTLLAEEPAPAASRTVKEPPDRALTDERIRQRILACRTAKVTLAVRDPAGRPLADTAVTVRQTRHRFLFGSNAYRVGRCRTPRQNDAYKRRFAALLNYATLPFYWNAYEQAEGKPDQDRLAAMARWCAANAIRTKGHPLCWHTSVPRWLAAKPPDQAQTLQLARITREVKTFAGLIDTWDVVNEAVAMPDHRQPNPISRMCKRLGRVGLIERTFAAARHANPKAALILNDFDTSPRYAKLIAECIKAGVPFDVIGIQSHMHKRYWGARNAWGVCQRFAQFGRPLQFTELTILSGKLKTDNDWMGHHPGWDTTADGERRQARQVAELYRVLFSHPAVEAITWWDFSDQAAWQGAPSGLIRKDMTPKPAYDALRELIRKQWWTGPLELTTDAAGRVSFRGFLGRYVVETKTGKATFALDRPGRAELTADLR